MGHRKKAKIFQLGLFLVEEFLAHPHHFSALSSS
jgi:hypothetical protein